MKAIAEVLSSSIKNFLAEAWPENLDEQSQETRVLPAFGSFLKCLSEDTNLEIYGIVYDVIIGPQDSHHKAVALKMSKEQLKKEQPQIFSLLKTEIHAAVCGYKKDGKFFARLPPQPPQVHDFVWALTKEEVKEASSNFEFLRLISWVTSVPNDELIAAAIREASAARDNDYQFLVEAGQNLSQLLREDYDRLVSVLKKINPAPN